MLTTMDFTHTSTTAQKERGGVMGAASSGATSMRRAVWLAANSAARDQMHRESTAPADEALMSQKAARYDQR